MNTYSPSNCPPHPLHTDKVSEFLLRQRMCYTESAVRHHFSLRPRPPEGAVLAALGLEEV